MGGPSAQERAAQIQHYQEGLIPTGPVDLGIDYNKAIAQYDTDIANDQQLIKSFNEEPSGTRPPEVRQGIIKEIQDRITFNQRRQQVYRDAAQAADINVFNAEQSRQRERDRNTLFESPNSSSSVGGGSLGGAGRAGQRVVSTSSFEDQTRAGYSKGSTPTLSKLVTDNFAPPEGGGIFAADRTASVPNPLAPTRAVPSSPGATNPQNPRVQAQSGSSYNPYGSTTFQKSFNPLGETPTAQPQITGARAGVKSVVPPIANRPLTGSTITARQLKQIQSGQISERSLLGLNENKLSSKILPDIVPSSTAFLSIPGSNELILPRPPVKPTSLSYTQEQVNNLSELDYKKYLADANRYNSQVAQFVKDVDSYNKQSKRETEIKAREYVSSQIRNGQSTFIIKSNGESKNVSPQQAVSEYKKALTKDPNAILTVPQLIQLSESLNITDKPLGATGFYQNEKGNVRTEISEIKPTEPIFRPNEFIPISVNRDFSVTGLGTLDNKRELLNLGTSELPKPREESNDIVSNINKFSKGIEEASQRGSQNYLTQTLGEAGKDLYSTGPAALNLINEYVVQPLQPKPRGIREVKEDLFYVPQTLTGIGAGGLVSAAKSQVEGKNGVEQLSKSYEEAGKYVGKYGPATIVGAGISIVAPTPAGGKLSPLKIGRQTFEIVPETGIKYNKVILKGTNEAGEIRSETFKTIEDATRRQQELIEKGISKDAKIHTEYTPVSSLQFVGNSLITKIGNKYYFGGLKGRVGELTEQYKKLNPAEPIEIATLKPFSRDTLLSHEGSQALVESGRALPRDIQALKIQAAITDIINKNRKYIKPKDYGNLTGITSLKTPQEQEVLLEEILPTSKVPTKGHAAEIAQVNPDILNQVATRSTTGDIDRDFVLAEPLRKIGLGSIAERLSYRAAKKDAERSQKLLQDVATGKRTFEVRGTKVYAVEGEGKTKVLENLTEKEATGKGSPISDFGKIFGSKYRYNIVKGLSPKGKKIPYRSIEDQLYSKIASISRLQSSKTGLFEQGGTPDYLPSGKFETTPEGFTIRTDLHRVKDFVDSIKLDIPEIGSRLKKSGKKTAGANLKKLGKELESLYPEVDFGATPNIAEDLAQNAPIPSIFSRVGITPNSIAKYSTGGISPLTTSKPSKPSPPQNNNIKSLVSNIGGSTSRLSTFSTISSKSILSDIVSNVKSPLSKSSSKSKSIIKSPSKSPSSISNRSSSPNSPLSKLSGLSGLSKISPISPISPLSPSSPITPISPISPISPILPIKPKKPIPPIPPISPKIPRSLNTRRKRFPHVEGLGKRTLFYTNPSDPLAPGVILKAGVPELQSASPKIFKEVDVLLRKARKRKGSTYGVYQPYRGLELKKIMGSGFKGTNLLSQKIHI